MWKTVHTDRPPCARALSCQPSSSRRLNTARGMLASRSPRCWCCTADWAQALHAVSQCRDARARVGGGSHHAASQSHLPAVQSPFKEQSKSLLHAAPRGVTVASSSTAARRSIARHGHAGRAGAALYSTILAARWGNSSRIHRYQIYSGTYHKAIAVTAAADVSWHWSCI